MAKPKLRLKGVNVPMITPFNSDESLDEEALRSLTEYLIENGVHGLFPNSSVGEKAKLSKDEMKRVMSIVVDQANGRIPVTPGTGDVSTRSTIELTRYAKDVGADAAVVIEPYYYRPTSDAIYEHYKSISESVDIPLVIYDAPVFTGYSLSTDLILRLAEIENIIAMKDSTKDMVRFLTLLDSVGEKISLLQGITKLFLPSLFMGSPGGFVGGGNVIPRLTVELYDSFQKGDYKKAIQLNKQLLAVFSTCEKYGTFPSGFKAAMEILELLSMQRPAAQI